MKSLITSCLGITLSLITASTALASVDERYAELQAVPEAINDPDPLMRLAQLEAIVAENDATKVQLALRTAFTVDDPNIRALALRAHFASYRTVVIETELPDEVKEALARDQEAAERQHRGLLNYIGGTGGQTHLYTSYENLSQIEFSFISLNNNDRREPQFGGTGSIRGTTITFSGVFRYTGTYRATCSFEFAEYEGFRVKGAGSCDMNDRTIPFPASIRLF